MLRRTEGIVLKTVPFGEADLIVTYLTADFGVMTAFAKSPRKTKSRFGSSLEPFTHSMVSFWGREDARLPRLTQSDIVRPFQGLREDLGCFLRVSEAADLTVNLLPEGEPNRKAFHLLRQALEMMEEGCRPLSLLIYKIRLLELTGLAPRLAGCARCGGPGRMFYLSQGSVVCPECSGKLNLREIPGAERKASLTLSAGAMRLYHALAAWEIEKTGRIKASEQMIKELTALLDEHIEYRLSKRLRTKEVHASFKPAV
jgi:DNA repair protein RecO (recombination protein O)